MASHDRRLFLDPVAAKVPEITAMFWVVKLLTTAGGEAMSDYLGDGNLVVGAAVEIGLLIIALIWQFRVRRYTAVSYWLLAYAIAVFGTGASDGLHNAAGVPYGATSLLWAVVLAAVFIWWYRSEGTLSIHSIITRRREGFYWAAVFATFALGTALGDYTGTSLGLGFLASIVLFFVVIMIPAVAWRGFGLNAVAAFWSAYVVTRPLGASVSDYLGKPHALSGANFGDAPTALVSTILVALGVGYLAITRHGIQQPFLAQPMAEEMPERGAEAAIRSE
ncbi:MAG: hypothetical protein FWE35_07355 [Streptosporangiales bacterium]|jgi:uncharacterized membrane-anchored protein|nr:hypothetical protein [Streptosporangiales bacterium]